MVIGIFVSGSGGTSQHSSHTGDSRSTDSYHTRSDNIAGVKEELPSYHGSSLPASVHHQDSNGPPLLKRADRDEPFEAVRHPLPSPGASNRPPPQTPAGSGVNNNYQDIRQDQQQQGAHRQEWQGQRWSDQTHNQQQEYPWQQNHFQQSENRQQEYNRQQDYHRLSQDNLNRFFQSWNAEGSTRMYQRQDHQEPMDQTFRQPPNFQDGYQRGGEQSWGQDYGHREDMGVRKRHRSPEPMRNGDMNAMVDRMSQGPSQRQVHSSMLIIWVSFFVISQSTKQ